MPFSDIESVGALGEDGFYVNVKDRSDDSKNHSVILNSANNYDSSVVNPFAIGREGYFDGPQIVHFDDFVYRSPLNPDTAILIPETRPPLDDGINKTNSHQYIELGNGNLAFVWRIYRQDLRDPDWSFEDNSYRSPIEIYARVINPETGEFITDEFRILENMEFPAIESVGAVGVDGFYVNATDEYDASVKYSTTVNGSNNYDSTAVNSFAIGRGESFVNPSGIDFDNFVYRSHLNQMRRFLSRRHAR